jgi:hypothetical protein
VEEVIRIGRWLMLLLVLLALAMTLEKVSGHSLWERFGAAATDVRLDKIRAVGPFRHAILAGSVGAALLPFVIALRSVSPRLAVASAVACVVITITSASSGPVAALAAGLFALTVWKVRTYRHALVGCAAIGLVVLQAVMDADVWYLMARVDFVGGSTGWHRARLIDQAIAHWDEWWFVGTDYTRHWMPYGVSWSPEHADFTNHFIWLGVSAGVGALLAHVAALTFSFRNAGHALQRYSTASESTRFIVWALGAVLFAHTVNSFGIAYFDQSVVLVYFVMACIGSLGTYPAALPNQAPVSGGQVGSAGRADLRRVPVSGEVAGRTPHGSRGDLRRCPSKTPSWRVAHDRLSIRRDVNPASSRVRAVRQKVTR